MIQSFPYCHRNDIDKYFLVEKIWSRQGGFANGDIASVKGSVLTFSLSLKSFLSPFTRTILRLLTFEANNRVSAFIRARHVKFVG